MVEEKLLLEYGATEKRLSKNETLFTIDSRPRYYYQVKQGQIKMNNFNDEGREFIQGIFSDGDSFGEPPLFGEFNYPAGAMAIEASTVIALPKESFFKLLKEHVDVTLRFTETLAKRLHYKATMAAEISTHESGHRILTLLDYFKENVFGLAKTDVYEVKLTRQQIADLTGLRVETVIRSMKKLDELGEIDIVNRKVRR